MLSTNNEAATRTLLRYIMSNVEKTPHIRYRSPDFGDASPWSRAS
jgi:hypothetical protein